MEGTDTMTDPLFWVKNQPVDSIWNPGVEDPYLARHLAEPVRVLIGFWRHPYIQIADRSDAAGVFPGEYIALNRMLYGSDEGIIVYCRKFGLPPSASVELKKPFQCQVCRGVIDHLPCIQCWNGPDDDPYVD